MSKVKPALLAFLGWLVLSGLLAYLVHLVMREPPDPPDPWDPLDPWGEAEAKANRAPRAIRDRQANQDLLDLSGPWENPDLWDQWVHPPQD